MFNQKKQPASGKQSPEQQTPATKPPAAKPPTTPAHDWQAKAVENLDRWKRTQADFDNYKKRQETMRIENRARLVADVAAELLPILDNLTRSLAVAKDKKDPLVVGVQHTADQFATLLKNLGLTPIPTNGPFDPHLHEAIAVQGEGETETIDAVVEAGYTIDGHVLRPAKVTLKRS